MPHKTDKPRITQADIDAQIEEDWQELLDLLVEAMQACLDDGTWIPGKGIEELEDTLETTLCGEPLTPAPERFDSRQGPDGSIPTRE